MDDPNDPLVRLLDLLDLERVGPDDFRGETDGEGGWRLFGGQVASQALRAAATTVRAGHHVNSLRAYFLLPGRFGIPITFGVDRIRDGTSFSTRRVVARQDGEAILNLDASFHREEPGDEHQPPSPVPLVDPPERGMPPTRPPWMRRRPVEMRQVAGRTPTTRAVWVRVPRPLPDDPVIHACLLTYLSDMGPVGVVSGSVGRERGALMMASLDHCLWFHRRVRADEWLLYELDAVAAANARGVARGSIWTRSGDLAVTLVQEVLARPRRR